MSRTKYLKTAALLLAAVLAVGAVIPAEAGEDDELYFEALESQIELSVTTVRAERKTFEINGSCKATLEYENVSYVFNTIDSGTVYFEERLVDNGDYVHRGDALVRVRVSVGDVEADKLAREIEVLEENLENYIDVNQALLMDYEDRAVNGATESERRTAGLLYDRLSKTYEEELADKQSELDNLRNTYESYEESLESQYITAPIDGVVSGFARLRTDDKMSYYSYVCAVYDTSNVKVRVSEGDKLTYGMAVTVVQGSGSEIISVEGRVVSSRNATLSANLIGSIDYIELLSDPSVFDVNEDTAVRFKSVYAENALVVPSKAVHVDSYGNYVYRYIDGKSVKRYVLTGGVNSEYTWIIDGLDEGDELVIK